MSSLGIETSNDQPLAGRHRKEKEEEGSVQFEIDLPNTLLWLLMQFFR